MKWGVFVLLARVLGFAMLRPVCVPLTPQDLAQFNSPIEQRADRDFYLKVFQRRHGQWHQRKTWISRQLFF